MYLAYAGFKVIIKAQWGDFNGFKKPFDFKKALLKQDCIFVRNCSTPLNTIVLVQPDTQDHIIHLSYGFHLAYKYNNIIQSGEVDCIAPYPMFPTQYKFSSDPSFSAALKNSKRTMKIFFAGDTDKNMYDRVKRNFNVISRNEIIEFILSHFDKSIILKSDADKSALKQLLDSEDYINNIIISQVKTIEKDWLKLLSKTDFFICPPGVWMPWSHNCIEAMSAGAIPILQYADLFYPQTGEYEKLFKLQK